MKITFYLTLICTFLLSAGCSTNSLVKKFKDRGITPATTAKLRFVGSEYDFGTDISVTTEDPNVIKTVWNSIYSATKVEPYRWSDFGKIEFYINKKAEWPAETLLVDPTNASFLDTDFLYQYDGDNDRMLGLMRCPGLHKLRMLYLEKERNRRKESPNS